MEQKEPYSELDYWKLWFETRDPKIGDHIIRMYIPLVQYHIQRISPSLPSSVNKDDLRSFALLGLYDALEKFDLSKESKFDTYASIRIRGAILDGLRKEDWLPRTSREKTKRLDQHIERLEQQFLRKPKISEIAETLEMSEKEVNRIVAEGYFANVISLDDFTHQGDDAKDHIIQVVRDPNVKTPEEEVLKQETLQDLLQSIQQYLTENEKKVIVYFYKEDKTFTEIGQLLGLSTSRISQIHAKAIQKLKVEMKKLK